MSKRAGKGDEVQVTADGGLVKKILEEGTGEIIPLNVVAKVHYTGRLQNGKVFDSSVSRNAPFKFTIGAFGDRRG
jgi:FKBP-type peptidyl-prolyl cis-trans isomerase